MSRAIGLKKNKEEMSKRIRKEQNESCSTSVVLLMPGHRYLQTEDQQLELRRNLNVPDHAGLHELFLCSSFFFLHTLGAAAMGCYGMLWDAMGCYGYFLQLRSRSKRTPLFDLFGFRLLPALRWIHQRPGPSLAPYLHRQVCAGAGTFKCYKENNAE